jgi:hypothetical protein
MSARPREGRRPAGHMHSNGGRRHDDTGGGPACKLAASHTRSRQRNSFAARNGEARNAISFTPPASSFGSNKFSAALLGVVAGPAG